MDSVYKNMILNNIICSTATNIPLNMKQKSKTKSISFIPPEPVPRILIVQTGSKRWKKWKGCIYISSFDLTGQVLMLLKDVKRNSNGLFLKNPIFAFVSTSKMEVESLISEKIISILKNK
jgi:hypothetical protein